MVDTESYYTKSALATRPSLGGINDITAGGVTDCLCHVCLKFRDRTQAKVSPFVSYDGIYPEVTKGLTAHQYFLCSDRITAYVLKARSWRKQYPSLAIYVQALHARAANRT